MLSSSYMKSTMLIRLNPDPAQAASLGRLQALFAKACSALGPVVREHRCWNRVALHHLTYRKLREDYPELGAQMVCNAIYSVCRSARQIYQAPGSPWNVSRRPEAGLPLLQFSAVAPVYFDRHTLSIRHGRLSMFTLDGRLHFTLNLAAEDERRFREERLKEIVLSRDAQGFFLMFSFGELADTIPDGVELPEYLIVLEPEAADSAVLR